VVWLEEIWVAIATIGLLPDRSCCVVGLLVRRGHGWGYVLVRESGVYILLCLILVVQGVCIWVLGDANAYDVVTMLDMSRSN